MYEIAHYLTDEGGDPFQEWLESLRDRRAQARILVRIE
jgi:putative component of toxin-antitoxin plasmid stabilization module